MCNSNYICGITSENEHRYMYTANDSNFFFRLLGYSEQLNESLDKWSLLIYYF